MNFRPKHIIHPRQFDLVYLHELFDLTDKVRSFSKSKEGLQFLSNLLPHKRAMLYFTQPSTRTFLSFQSACSILGMKTSEVRDTSVSSEKKGESVEDSLRTFSSYVDLIIMRSPLAGLCHKIASLLDETSRPVPVINAGSGPDTHPTQALLDIYTLHRSFSNRGGISGKTICMVGDLKRGRTVRSLCELLMLFKDVKLILTAPKTFQILDDLRGKLINSPNISFVENENFNDAVSQADAVYMTRMQDEYSSPEEDSFTNIDQFSFTEKHLELMKEDGIILHPMPRREELDPRVDKDPRALYWRQERNGMWVRVALILKIFGMEKKGLFSL